MAIRIAQLRSNSTTAMISLSVRVEIYFRALIIGFRENAFVIPTSHEICIVPYQGVVLAEVEDQGLLSGVRGKDARDRLGIGVPVARAVCRERKTSAVDDFE